MNKVKKETRPSLLVTYAYLNMFMRAREAYDIRDWAMDSGAFSVWRSGAIIDLDKYIDKCLELMETEKNLVEIFALDVIAGKDSGITRTKGAEQSLKNTERMWAAGVRAIPTYHIGEPEEFLFHLAKRYPKIALGGTVGVSSKTRVEFYRQCFARVWPKKIHGFGIAGVNMFLNFPFHSTDSTSWEIKPCQFGYWKAFGGTTSVRGSSQNLRAEVEHYLKLEHQAQQRWSKEMELLGLEDKTRPDVKLAHSGSVIEGGGQRQLSAFGKKKTVRRLK